MNYYFYDAETKNLSLAPRTLTIDGALVSRPTAAQYAALGAYPLVDQSPTDPAPEGCHWKAQGYALDEQSASIRRIYTAVPDPPPTLADYDAAMEDHLLAEREARGYTTREPDAYLTSSEPRWSQDAMDWVAHRDAVMGYALALINAVESGTREPPTMAEFRAGLPRIEWSYAEQEGA